MVYQYDLKTTIYREPICGLTGYQNSLDMNIQWICEMPLKLRTQEKSLPFLGSMSCVQNNAYSRVKS